MLTIEWLKSNYSEVLQIITLIVVIGEMVARLTPTKTDDGFIHRIGGRLDRILDLLRVPNLRKKIDDKSID